MNPIWSFVALACLAAGVFFLAVIRFRQIRRNPALRKAAAILLIVFPLAAAGLAGTRFPHVSKALEPLAAVLLLCVTGIPLFFLFGSRSELADEVRTDVRTRRLLFLALLCLGGAFLVWLLLAKNGEPIFPR